ncbi:MAG: AAA family ATPase, partial [Bradyrhizobium sp.]
IWSKQSRRLSLDVKSPDGHLVEGGNRTRVVLGPGYGLHFFIADGWLFWFNKSMLDSSGSESIKEQIALFCLGRDKARIERVVERFRPKPASRDGLDVFRYGEHGWWRAATISQRPLRSVVIAADTLNRITKQLDEFRDQRHWYLNNGLTHKLTILLHGRPGCGKTSLIKALAGHYGVDIYSININQMTDRSFGPAIASVPKGAFLLIEDFDSASAVKARPSKQMNQPRTHADDIAEAVADFSPLSLTGVLNAMDGIVPLDNNVVFMTTNHIELIDDAMLRKGRTDLIVEIGPMGPAEIATYIEHVYGVKTTHTYPPMLGCDLQSLVLEHKGDFQGFTRALAEAARPHLAITNEANVA